MVNQKLTNEVTLRATDRNEPPEGSVTIVSAVETILIDGKWYRDIYKFNKQTNKFDEPIREYVCTSQELAEYVHGRLKEMDEAGDCRPKPL